MKLSVILAVAAMLVSCPLSIRAAESEASGDVELLVRGPDDEPLANKAIFLESLDPYPGSRSPNKAEAMTDQHGVARFPWPSGVDRMMVRAAGVGYGATGLFEVVPGRPVRLSFAPLVAFAVLEGTVPKALLGPQVVLKLYCENSWANTVTVPISEDGRFQAEVAHGAWWAYAVDDKQQLAELPGKIQVAPGQKVGGLDLRALKPADRRVLSRSYRTVRPGMGEKITWARGTVRDADGKPLMGAKVWATAVYHGGLRMYEKVEAATTDGEGRYEIKGDGGLSLFSASIVGYVPGKPLGWAWVAGSDGSVSVPVDVPPPPPRPVPPAPTVDLVIPNRGGEMEVAVVQNGQPARGASVELSLEGVNLRDVWAAGGGSPEMEALVHPVRTTDADGVARFDALLPGGYRIVATEGNQQSVRPLEDSWRRAGNGPYGIATGVPVRVGQKTTYRMATYAQSNAAPIRILKTDGTPMAADHVPYEYGPVSGGGGVATSLSLDVDGRGRPSFDSAGLWHVQFKYRDSPTPWIPLTSAPYCGTDGFVAVSPALAQVNKAGPATFRAMRYEPGIVVVEIKDAQGRPARGFVEIGPESGEPVLMGSTDAMGVVRFEGVPRRQYLVRGHLLGREPPEFGHEALPGDEQLLGRFDVRAEPVNPQLNAVYHIALREQHVGYIRGKLRPPRECLASEFTVLLSDTETLHGAKCDYRSDSGEFVAGPFATGDVRLRIWRRNSRGLGGTECGVQQVRVEGGKATHIDLDPTGGPADPIAGDGSALVGAGGMTVQGTGAQRLTGTVMLPGGKGPALGALVRYFEPEHWEPVLGGITDARGQIRAKDLWYSGNKTTEPPDDPPGPVLVALLPGSYGATIVSMPATNKPIEATLPPAISMHGKITVAGASPAGRPGNIRVFAAYGGKRRLAGILSVQTTAQEDGTFDLGGLTPGRYTVQAALDDIWLSSSTAIEVTDRSPEAITLDIPAPGGPAVIRVIGADGKPLVGQPLVIDRPEGPLASELWPVEWRTDGAGQVWIPTLEAGRHHVRVHTENGEDVTGEVTISALPVDRPAELQIRLDAEGRR